MYKFDQTFTHSLDQKNRVFVPADYRSMLGPEFVICVPPGSKDCVVIYPLEEWDKYFRNLRRVATGYDRAMLERIAMSSKKTVSADKQGRITLPQSFCEAAHLEGEAMLMGVENRVEIWNPEVWQQSLRDWEASRMEYSRAVDLSGWSEDEV